MSTAFVDSLNQVGQLNDEYTTLLNQKREEMNQAAAAFNNDMRARINFYNTVLYNTFMKFNQPKPGFYGTLGSNLYTKHKISPDTKIETSDRDSAGNLYLISATDNIRIPYYLLRNDPMAVSSYARHLARREQAEIARNEHAKHLKEQKSLQTQVNRLNRELAAATMKTQLAESQVDNITNHILRKKGAKKK